MHCSNLIDGDWIDGAAAENANPSDTADLVGTYATASIGDTRAAIDGARAAFGRWQYAAPLDRHAILAATARELADRKTELGTLLSREEGRTLPEAIAEVGRAAQIFDFFAGEALRLTGETGASARPGIEVMVTREPVGVIGIITPWNFPIAIPAWKIAPALAHGNCGVFKAASLVPGSAWALIDILDRAGAPRGVVNLVMGDVRTIGQTMIESEKIDAISFTGSTKTGARIVMASAERMRRVQLGMGARTRSSCSTMPICRPR